MHKTDADIFWEFYHIVNANWSRKERKQLSLRFWNGIRKSKVR